MTLRQAFLDRVRVMNKYATNKLLIHICGKRFGHFSILTHTGRRTGKRYRTPIIAEPVENGFVIALTYGRKVDWAANILAQGGGSLLWKEAEYCLRNPEFIDKEIGSRAFPVFIRAAFRVVGIRDFLRLTVSS
jgi:deazaflavin-dependent oxidoreductase (nitroreductase family)